jgi:hypothetical protein
MTGDRVQARRARWLGVFSVLACLLALVSLLGLVRSLMAMTYLNVRFVHEVNPLSRAVSYYVFTERGAGVFAVTLSVVALATFTILVGMAQLRVRIGSAAATLFGVWSVALVLCAVFPTDNAPRIESVHGWIHQFAGASLFVSLPLAGLALGRSLRAQPEWAATGRTPRARCRRSRAGISRGAAARPDALVRLSRRRGPPRRLRTDPEIAVRARTGHAAGTGHPVAEGVLDPAAPTRPTGTVAPVDAPRTLDGVVGR